MHFPTPLRSSSGMGACPGELALSALRNVAQPALHRPRGPAAAGVRVAGSSHSSDDVPCCPHASVCGCAHAQEENLGSA